MQASKCFAVSEISQVGEARRAAVSLAEDLGFSEELRGQLAIVVTELGSNLVKHTRGGGGRLIIRVLNPEEGGGVELLSLDQGPGMANVACCMGDGYSTAGSPGTGLGAISRLSGFFDIYSQPGAGTVVASRVYSGTSPRASAFELGAVCIPIQGEQVCGDAVEAHLGVDAESVLVADGLGHGPLAAEASQEAVRRFRESEALSSADIVNAIHLGLRSTRGAAVAVARIDRKESLVRYSGLGNISGVVLSSSGEQRRMVSHNGTAGVQIRRIQEFVYPWEQDSVLVMHSDGVLTHWGLERYPGLLARHPALIAGIIYRDFNRGRDDVSVLVLASRAHRVSWKGAA